MTHLHQLKSRYVRKGRISSSFRKGHYRKTLSARRISLQKKQLATKSNDSSEKKNLMDLFGILGDGKQTNEDFENIRKIARKKHYEWLKSEGKF